MIDDFPLMKTVYSYFFPEVRSIVRLGEQIPDELFLTSTSREQAQEYIDELGLPIEVPGTPGGLVDLDAIHEPVIEKIIDNYKHLVPGLKDFPYRYFTPGSSQGIFHTLAECCRLKKSIHTLHGEYEGFLEYASTIGKEKSYQNIHDKEKILDYLKYGFHNGWWFISNPSAIDGNILPNEFINKIAERNLVALDLAYVGSTKQHEFDVTHENIKTVFLSLSKPYGVFRFRMGITFSREPIESLYANKWFKDVPRLLTALALTERIPPGFLYNQYREEQKEIVDSINNDYRLNIKPSDSLLLGHIPKDSVEKLSQEQQQLIEPFKRDQGYRFCLTPMFELYEKYKRICVSPKMCTGCYTHPCMCEQLKLETGHE